MHKNSSIWNISLTFLCRKKEKNTFSNSQNIYTNVFFLKEQRLSGKVPVENCFIFYSVFPCAQRFESLLHRDGGIILSDFSVSHFSPHSRVFGYGSDALQLEVIKNKLITKKFHKQWDERIFMLLFSGRFMIYFLLALPKKKIKKKSFIWTQTWFIELTVIS